MQKAARVHAPLRLEELVGSLVRHSDARFVALALANKHITPMRPIHLQSAPPHSRAPRRTTGGGESVRGPRLSVCVVCVST